MRLPSCERITGPGKRPIFAGGGEFPLLCSVWIEWRSLQSVHIFAAGRLSVLARAHVPNVKEDEWRGNSAHFPTPGSSLMPQN